MNLFRYGPINDFKITCPKLKSSEAFQNNICHFSRQDLRWRLVNPAMFICSQYFKNEDDFDKIVPSAAPMNEKLMAIPKISQWLKSQKSVPFTPYI